MHICTYVLLCIYTLDCKFTPSAISVCMRVLHAQNNTALFSLTFAYKTDTHATKDCQTQEFTTIKSLLNLQA